jgi:hypothetical protein
MFLFARALKDKGTLIPEIAKKLSIKTGKNAGKHPSVASLYRALAETDSQHAATRPCPGSLSSTSTHGGFRAYLGCTPSGSARWQPRGWQWWLSQGVSGLPVRPAVSLLPDICASPRAGVTGCIEYRSARSGRPQRRRAEP